MGNGRHNQPLLFLIPGVCLISLFSLATGFGLNHKLDLPQDTSQELGAQWFAPPIATQNSSDTRAMDQRKGFNIDAKGFSHKALQALDNWKSVYFARGHMAVFVGVLSGQIAVVAFTFSL